ncbi:MAG: glycosyltransferase [Rhodovarius sp.]|nr:glycosyltransferase [Rhodovarius sp.]
MRILFVSVHEVHEYDEVRLLTDLGHQVFPLGHHHRRGPYPGLLRPPLDLGPEHARLQQAFEEMGCRYDIADPIRGTVLQRAFVELFDLTIVVFNPFFIHHFREVLSARPIVLRTIGQAINQWEHLYAELRAQGVRLVRYAEAEAEQDNYAGHDAVIRFAKYPEDFPPWRGDRAAVLTFAASFAQRYPAEFALWRQATQGLPVLLGGPNNAMVDGAIGALGMQEQLDLLASCRAYFYCSGLAIPYTLNFIEAWLAGIPVVVMDDRIIPRSPRCSEIARLIAPGENCLLVRDAEEARAARQRLLEDPGYGARIGAAGRATARRIFGREGIAAAWQEALARFATPR